MEFARDSQSAKTEKSKTKIPPLILRALLLLSRGAAVFFFEQLERFPLAVLDREGSYDGELPF